MDGGVGNIANGLRLARETAKRLRERANKAPHAALADSTLDLVAASDLETMASLVEKYALPAISKSRAVDRVF